MWKTTDKFVQQKRLKAQEGDSKVTQIFIPSSNTAINLTLAIQASSQYQVTPTGTLVTPNYMCESCFGRFTISLHIIVVAYPILCYYSLILSKVFLMFSVGISQPAFTCSKLIIETLEKKVWNMFKVIVDFEHISHFCSSVSIVKFEHIITGWVKGAAA